MLGLRHPTYLRKIVNAMLEFEELLIRRNRYEYWMLTPLCSVFGMILRRLSIPRPKIVFKAGLAGGDCAHFDPYTWTISFDHLGLGCMQHPREQSIENLRLKISHLGSSLTHEARHCEQYYRIAWVIENYRHYVDHSLSLDRTMMERLVEGISPKIWEHVSSGHSIILLPDSVSEVLAWMEDFKWGKAELAYRMVRLKPPKVKRDAKNYPLISSISMLSRKAAYYHYKQLNLEKDAFAAEKEVADRYIQSSKTRCFHKTFLMENRVSIDPLLGVCPEEKARVSKDMKARTKPERKKR